MKSGIEFTVLWSDQDVIKVRCSNGRFSGDATMYFAHDDLSKLVQTLSGFPSHAGDLRRLEFGTFERNYAGGGIRMHFFCRDSVGHAVVDVQLSGDNCLKPGEPESVRLCMNVEAAGVDSFLAQLGSLDPNEIGASVCLEMAI